MVKQSVPFRQHHFFQLLRSFDPTRGPIDVFVSLYFRHNPQLGSKDRAEIVERIYKFFRWKGLYDHVLKGTEEKARDQKLYALLSEDPLRYAKENLPRHIRVSFPKVLFERIENSWKEETTPLCFACNTPAPLVLRANLLKTTKQELLQRFLAQNIFAEELPGNALYLPRRINFCSLPEFTEGLFEVQDLGSQCVAECVQATPGQSVLDYCAGSGGKSLSIAVRLENKGQLFLHDIRPQALIEAKKRLRRAGVGNAQIVSHLPRIKGRMDWVLADVPCSGTGTLRRNPDMKWKFSEEMLQRLVAEQRQIFSEAVSFPKIKGHIVYATCSLLREENDDQVAYFLSQHPLKLVGLPFRSSPHTTQMDGFFAACFQKI